MDKNINPLVSIIMPAFNAEEFIYQSINSVINQTYKRWELIIIDDGSTDNTSSIIFEESKKDHRLVCLSQENEKQWKARNKGIKYAKGELIAFLDADDLWLPKKLEISIEEFVKNKQDLLFTNALYFFKNEDTENINSLNDFGINEKIYYGVTGILSFFEINRIPILTVLVKKDVLKCVGGFADMSPAEDYELWIRLLYNNFIIRSITPALSLYRIHKHSSSSKDRHASKEIIKVINMYCQKSTYINEMSTKYKRKWLKYWICTNLNYNNISSYKEMVMQTGQYNFTQKITLRLANIIPLRLLKKILIHSF